MTLSDYILERIGSPRIRVAMPGGGVHEGRLSIMPRKNSPFAIELAAGGRMTLYSDFQVEVLSGTLDEARVAVPSWVRRVAEFSGWTEIVGVTTMALRKKRTIVQIEPALRGVNLFIRDIDYARNAWDTYRSGFAETPEDLEHLLKRAETIRSIP